MLKRFWNSRELIYFLLGWGTALSLVNVVWEGNNSTVAIVTAVLSVIVLLLFVTRDFGHS